MATKASQRPVSSRGASAPGKGRGGRSAAAHATERNTIRVDLPAIGTVTLPSRNQLAFLGGIGLLAMAGAIDWPVAGVLAVGHLLAASSSNKTLQDFGEALEQA